MSGFVDPYRMAWGWWSNSAEEPPDIPGVEFVAPRSALDFRAPSSKLDFVAGNSKLDFVTQED